MPGLLRKNIESPFSIDPSNYLDRRYGPRLNFEQVDLEDEADDIETDIEEEDIEDQEMQNHELSELLDRILYGQQRPLPHLENTRHSYTSRAREPVIRFGNSESSESPEHEEVELNEEPTVLRSRYQ